MRSTLRAPIFLPRTLATPRTDPPQPCPPQHRLPLHLHLQVPASRRFLQETVTSPPQPRADGSLRKEIKIRPGYRPPEDVEVYKNRTAEAWKTSGTGGIPGAAGLKEGGADQEKSGAAGKNAKRREARKRAKAAEEGVQEGAAVEVNGEVVDMTKVTPKAPKDQATNSQSAPASAAEVKEGDDLEEDKEKQARALKKKLRQARELKEKKDSGEGLLPEQFAKVIKIHELIRQLEALGFDSDGAKKAKDVR